MPPSDVVWQVGETPGDLFGDEAILESGAPQLRVPRPFVDLARTVVLHADPQRFALLDTALLAAVTSGGERRTAAAPSAALEGWHLLNASAGRMSICALAASTGWSVRHVHTCFVSEFG